MDFKENQEILGDFVESATEFLDEFERLVMQIENSAATTLQSNILPAIFNSLHTFKGNSGMMGLYALQRCAHLLEDLFAQVQRCERGLDPILIQTFMAAADSMRNAVWRLRSEDPKELALEQELDMLERILQVPQEATADAASDPRSTGVFASPALADEVDGQPGANGHEQGVDETDSVAQRSNVIKVDFSRLDELMNLMGELVICHTRLGRVDTKLVETFGDRGVVHELSDTTEQLGKVATELHEAIMKVRMLPIKRVFARFPRLVRDLSHSTNKDVSVFFEGEETELDKTIIDEIGEPLLHLIRNAVDHGIEGVRERVDRGKPPRGTIRLRARQESNHILITVDDDGGGIDIDRLRERAVSEHLLSDEEARQRSLQELIFVRGLSTAGAITEVSGRGVGMDTVAQSLAKINGTINVSSQLGVGTRFTIKLPLTLAIISALMVEVSGERYAIPLSSVVESLKIRERHVHRINRRDVINVRGDILPLVHLSDIFGLPRRARGDTHYVVVVQGGSGHIGVAVDALVERQEIVIKALDDYVGAATGVAGATILGDGRVVLIVDVSYLVNRPNAQIQLDGHPHQDLSHGA